MVTPAIEEGDSGLTGAVEEFERMQRGPTKGLRLGLLHGRMPQREKDATMARFARGEIDVLVATTVVEVGIDVANATVMVVLDAHRYGLAQLHQLRGRVGRGAIESYCVLAYDDEAGERDRLGILTRTTDGFVIAEEDLRLRGPGEFAGTVQSGSDGLRFADLARDLGVYARSQKRSRNDRTRRRTPRASGERRVALGPGTTTEHAQLVTLVVSGPLPGVERVLQEVAAMRFSRTIVAALATLTAFCCSSLAARAAGDVTRATLPNGLQVVVVRDTLAPVVTTMLELQSRFERTVDRRARPCDRTHDVPRQRNAVVVTAHGNDGDHRRQLRCRYAEQRHAILLYGSVASILDIALRVERARATGLLMAPGQWAQERGATTQEVTQDNSDAIYRLFVKMQNRLVGGIAAQ